MPRQYNSCYEQNFVAIILLESRWEQNEICIRIWIAMEKMLVKLPLLRHIFELNQGPGPFVEVGF